MDPLSIAAAAASLVFTVVRNGKALAGVYEKYQDSRRCLFLMQTECTVLAAALSQLQMHFSSVSPSAMTRYPEFVIESIDLSLVGCTLTLSVLSKEIENMMQRVGEAPIALSKGKKIRYLWKEESMLELLQQLRGQSSALNLLLRALDSSSIEKILGILQSGQHTFQQVRQGSASIREAYPREGYAESILNMTFDDTKTLYSLGDYEQFPGDKDVDSLSGYLNSTSLTSGSAKTESNQLPEDQWPPQGWQKYYDASKNKWYSIDPATGEIVWPDTKSPYNPSLAASGTNPNTSTPRRPVPAQAAPNVAVINEPRGLPPRPPQVSHEAADFAPWKMNTDAKFMAALENLRKEKNTPAMAVGVVSVDAPPKVHVVGYRKQGSEVPATRADSFLISNANHFTNAAMGVLVQRGLFQWEETVLQLFPSLARRMHPFHHQTTLAMLAGHVAGFEARINNVEDGELWDYLRHGGATPKDQRLAVAMSYLYRPPDNTPGSKDYEYNWANPILVASAMEQRTNSTLEVLVKALIFDPLEMYSARFNPPPATGPNNTPTQPYGHDEKTRAAIEPTDNYIYQGAFNASTSVFCSPPDFASFVAMQLRASMGQTTPVLDGRSTPGKAMFTKLPDKCCMPACWIGAVRDWAGGEAIWMNGMCDGWSMSIWMAPLKGRAYFALVNVAGEPGTWIADSAVSLAIRLSTR